MDSLRNSLTSNENVWTLEESDRNLDLGTNGSDGSHCVYRESHRNLDLEANGSDLMVLIGKLIGI